VLTPASFTSYCGLCIVQGAIVLFPGVLRSRFLAALRARWLLITAPAALVTAATFLPRVATVLAVSLSSLALVVVPPLAVLGIGWAMRWRDWRLVPAVAPLLALAWLTPGSVLGKAAVLLLVSLSCVGLAALVIGIIPTAVAKVGIALWAAADLSLALAHGLERASRAITEAAPAIGPEQLQLQHVVIGTSSMEYADLFVAAVLGAVLGAQGRKQGPAALLVATFGMSLAAFLLVTDVLPATVPVAAALGVEELYALRARQHPRRLDSPLAEQAASSSSG
jgi:hypothetical protein